MVSTSSDCDLSSEVCSVALSLCGTVPSPSVADVIRRCGEGRRSFEKTLSGKYGELLDGMYEELLGGGYGELYDVTFEGLLGGKASE